jgi:hypothetical protein
MDIKYSLYFAINVIFIIAAIMAQTGCAGTGTNLSKAAFEGQSSVVKEILNKGADVNERGACDWRWSNVTALSCAAYGGHIDTVKILIERGANVNASSNDGWTPLMSAACIGHAGIANLLIEKGADIDGAMASLAQWGPGRNCLIFLQRIAKKQQPSGQTLETSVITPSQKVYSAVKSDVDDLPSLKMKQNKNAYAIVIGIENYRQKLPKADYAVADATIISEYLIKTMGYPEENVITLLNDRALKSDLEKYFDRWLSNNVEENSRVFIYYSGHGAPNTKTGDAYLVPYDGDPTFITETGYSMARLYESLGRLRAKDITVVLDSCFSGAGGRSVLAKGAKPLVITINTPNIKTNISVMTGSSGDQISSAYEEKGHGLFTYYLLKGIKDENVIQQDGSINMDDLYNYVKPQVERIARKQYNNEQTPQLIGAKKN